MAQMFISESSRRTQQIPEAEMAERWEKGFGQRKRQTCSECGEETHQTKNGLCSKCRSAKSTIKVETHECKRCHNTVVRVNEAGFCYTCNAIARMEENEGEGFHGQ